MVSLTPNAGILFKHIESVVSRFFDTEGETFSHEKNTLFVENSISILKSILERAEELNPEHLLSVDFGSLILSFVQYLNCLTDSSQAQTALWIKVKMCQLSEVLVAKKELVGLRQEIKLRNRLLEIFLSWNSEFQNVCFDLSQKPEDDKNSKLIRDLDVASIKAMVKVLAGLPLQYLEPVPDLGYDSDDDDCEQGPLFKKYLSFFLKVLQKSKKDQQDKDHTILALSNLLSANLEVGLKHCLAMAYHEDPKTRTAFAQVSYYLISGHD